MNLIRQGMYFSKNIKVFKRVAFILRVVAKNGLWSLTESSGILSMFSKEQVKSASKFQGISKLKRGLHVSSENLPQQLRAMFEDLGPVFVKLGQLLATREDVIPQVYCDEFKKLQSSVKAVGFSGVEQILKEDFGEDYLDKFDSFDTEPIAAGSIAQVYRASYHGQQVVVKVKRPEIDEIFKLDLFLLDRIAERLEEYFPETKKYQLKSIVKEFTKNTVKELDFIREKATEIKFKKIFESSSFVVVPKVYNEMCSKRVITSSYIEKAADWDRQSLINAGLDPDRLITRGLSAVMTMMFEAGFVHGDLHSGNIIAMRGNKIGFIDFGITISISKSVRADLIGMFLSLIKEDYEGYLYHLLNLVKTDHNFDSELFLEELVSQVTPYMGSDVKSIPTIQIVKDLAMLAGRHGASYSGDLILVVRNLSYLDSMAKQISPEFDILEYCTSSQVATRDYSIGRFKEVTASFIRDLAGFLRTTPKNLSYLLKDILEGSIKINVVNQTQIDSSRIIKKGLYHLGVGIIMASILLSSTLLICFQVEPLYRGYSVAGIIGWILGFMGALRLIRKNR